MRVRNSLFLLVAVLLACRLQAPVGEVQESSDPWAPVRAAIQESDFEDVTVIVGDAGGALFTFSKGDSTPDTVYDLASASKWLSAAVVLRLVEDGVLELDDHPQEFIPWWTADPEDPRSRVTLAQLLSFTAGFDAGPFEVPCVANGDTTLDACGRVLVERYFAFEPGTSFYYGPAHLHTAALMAEHATGRGFQELFREEIADPLGMSASAGFFAPGPDNPRAAGGASASARDYALFLQALLRGDLLSETFDLMTADHTPAGEVVIVSSPVTRQGYEWHYGFGLWRECLAEVWEPDCNAQVVVSSPGAFGFYPWMDPGKGYFVVIAVQEPLRLLERPSEVSVEFGIELRPLIEAALHGNTGQ